LIRLKEKRIVAPMSSMEATLAKICQDAAESRSGGEKSEGIQLPQATETRRHGARAKKLGKLETNMVKEDGIMHWLSVDTKTFDKTELVLASV
jgi:hypothetical protein